MVCLWNRPVIGLAALLLAGVATVAEARKGGREWDRAMPCPTDAPVLVGSEGAASRFSALQSCGEVRVVPQATGRELADADDGDYTIRATPRDADGRLKQGFALADLGTELQSSAGDVHVSRERTESGTTVIRIAPVEEKQGGAAPAVLPTLAPTVTTIAATPAPAAPIVGEPLLELRPARTSRFDSDIAEVAKRQRVDPLLLHAVIKQESAYRPTVVSHAGAVGMMQIMPGTGRQLGVSPAYLTHPRTNVEAGARELRRLANKFGSDFKLVLAAYNAGEGAVRKYGNQIPPYAETQAYVRKVLSEYSRLCAENGIHFASGY